VEHFKDLPDPRMVNKCDPLLLDIIMIAICATIADADSWEEIADFGSSREAWLKQWLSLPHGIPTHDTFYRVFERLDEQAFQERFMSWVQAVFEVTEGQVIAIDGKTQRGSCDRQGQGGLHLVSAWATANRLTLGQVKVESNANEIVAIPELLDLLILKGAIVTLDAMGCQKTIAQQIVHEQADYVLSVKQNQPTLYRHVQACFAQADATGFMLHSPHYCQTEDRQHGRLEKRQCWVIADSAAQQLGWNACNTLVRITRERELSTGEKTAETQYYISSLPPHASLMLAAIRAHWGIENQCHWLLDVVFQEDAHRTRTPHPNGNLALLRKIALNLLARHPAKRSLKGKRYRAALNEDFLFEVLHSSFNLMR
jgi:predicted transposase YbfD/YdcC